MTIPLIMLVIGIFLSALFSGSETGFYRASRVRVVMAGLDGDRTSQALLKLFNNPTWFVATTLIGNNVANYLTSLAIVLLARTVAGSSAAEMLMPILFSPLLFIYGELLPKSLFYQAPNKLLRFWAPLFLMFSWIFAPVAAILWAMGQFLKKMIGQSPEKIRLTLARKELQQVLEEGLEAGILEPTQRQLAQSFFLVASKPVKEFCTLLPRVRSISKNSSRTSVMKLAKQNRLSDIPVYHESRNNLIGYVRMDEILVEQQADDDLSKIHPLMEIDESELFGEAVIQMQSSRSTLARVIDSSGGTIGTLSIDQLTDPLLAGSLGSLKR